MFNIRAPVGEWASLLASDRVGCSVLAGGKLKWVLGSLLCPLEDGVSCWQEGTTTKKGKSGTRSHDFE